MTTGHAIDQAIAFMLHALLAQCVAALFESARARARTDARRQARLALRKQRVCPCEDGRKPGHEPVCRQCYQQAPNRARLLYQDRHDPSELIAFAAAISDMRNYMEPTEPTPTEPTPAERREFAVLAQQTNPTNL